MIQETDLTNVFTLKALRQIGNTSTEVGEREFAVQGVINKEHWIYSAHFPGSPITPGAVILHTVQQIVCQIVSKRYKITKIKDVRFLKPIVPTETGSVNFEMRVNSRVDGVVEAECNVTDGGQCKFAKISITLC